MALSDKTESLGILTGAFLRLNDVLPYGQRSLRTDDRRCVGIERLVSFPVGTALIKTRVCFCV